MYRSLTGVARQTVTPPMADDMALTPLKLMTAANGMSTPVIFSTVSTTHGSPPRESAVLNWSSLDPGTVPLPSGDGQSGMGTIRSRGKLTTTALLWSSAMCSSIVTSLLPAPLLASCSSAEE